MGDSVFELKLNRGYYFLATCIKNKNPEEIDTPRGFLIPQPYGLAVWTGLTVAYLCISLSCS